MASPVTKGNPSGNGTHKACMPARFQRLPVSSRGEDSQHLRESSPCLLLFPSERLHCKGGCVSLWVTFPPSRPGRQVEDARPIFPIRSGRATSRFTSPHHRLGG